MRIFPSLTPSLGKGRSNNKNELSARIVWLELRHGFTRSYFYALKEIINRWKKSENLTFTDALIKERKIKQQELIISENTMARIKSWFKRSYFYTLKETKPQVFKLWILTIHAVNLCAILIQRERVLGLRFFFLLQMLLLCNNLY